jgi:FdrA protein
MPEVRYRLKPALYRDSVALMRLALDLQARPGIRQAAALMATPANRATLDESGLTWPADVAGRADDLLIVAAGDSAAQVEAALDWAEARLLSGAGAAGQAGPGPAADGQPHSLAEALQSLPRANLALISVPGEYAYAEALKALKAGRHVFLFSNGVSLEDEARLKQFAAARSLLVMGPDCGTSLVAGVPLGFANAVRRGNIGLVAASGSGLQEVMCLIDDWGGGVSHAIGAGGRDLHERIGGATTLAGLRLLQADPATEAVVVLSKPPSPAVAERVRQAARTLGKPCVIGFLGDRPEAAAAGGLRVGTTLEEVARLALAAVGQTAPELPAPIARHVSPPRRFIRGLFAGGTLCSEAAQILQAGLGEVRRSAEWGRLPAAHLCLDLGDELYTHGRVHPMIDARLRADWLRLAAQDAETAVVLFDVILGYGASPDPAGLLLEAIRPGEGGPVYLARVCGTAADPQDRAGVVARLRAAGVSVAPSNAAAARLAMEIVRS